MGLAAFYALASGATLFAMEREAETYDFLRALPVTPLVVFAGKIAFALASAAALFLVAWTLALMLAGELPNPLFHRRFGPFAGWPASSFGLGNLFLLVAEASAAGGHSCRDMRRSVIITRFMDTIDPRVDFIKTVPGRLLIVAICGGGGHLAGGRAGSARGCSLPARQRSPRASRRTGWASMRAAVRCRHARPAPMAGISAVGRDDGGPDRHAAPHGFLLLRELAISVSPRYAGTGSVTSCLLCVRGLLQCPAAGLLGVPCGSDGLPVPLLAEHGVPPRLVWLSRQIRGLLVMLLGLLLILLPLIGIVTKDS